jgi:hypothetical protein
VLGSWSRSWSWVSWCNVRLKDMVLGRGGGAVGLVLGLVLLLMH